MEVAPEREGPSEPTTLDRAASARIALLARRYVQEKLSREEEARLAIADAEFDALAPRVTDAELADLRRLRDELARMKEDADREWEDLTR